MKCLSNLIDFCILFLLKIEMSKPETKVENIPSHSKNLCIFCEGEVYEDIFEKDTVCESCCIYLGDVVCEELKLTMCCLMQLTDEEMRKNQFDVACLCNPKKKEKLKQRKVYTPEEIKKIFKWPKINKPSVYTLPVGMTWIPDYPRCKSEGKRGLVVTDPSILEKNALIEKIQKIKNDRDQTFRDIPRVHQNIQDANKDLSLLNVEDIIKSTKEIYVKEIRGYFRKSDATLEWELETLKKEYLRARSHLCEKMIEAIKSIDPKNEIKLYENSNPEDSNPEDSNPEDSIPEDLAMYYREVLHKAKNRIIQKLKKKDRNSTASFNWDLKTLEEELARVKKRRRKKKRRKENVGSKEEINKFILIPPRMRGKIYVKN